MPLRTFCTKNAPLRTISTKDFSRITGTLRSAVLQTQQYKYKLAKVYILENTPPPPRGGKNISRCHLRGQNMKSGREKEGKCKRKRKKVEKKKK
jgi:hypothetical protein